MTISIQIFDYELKLAEEIIKDFPELDAKFSPKKKVLKFENRNHYNFFTELLEIHKEEESRKRTENGR